MQMASSVITLTLSSFILSMSVLSDFCRQAAAALLYLAGRTHAHFGQNLHIETILCVNCLGKANGATVDITTGIKGIRGTTDERLAIFGLCKQIPLTRNCHYSFSVCSQNVYVLYSFPLHAQLSEDL